MAYSLDLRERVIAHVEDGNTQLSASELFVINDKTVRKWIELKQKQVHWCPEPLQVEPSRE